MIISFSGIDGSGKSTQAQYVADYLREQGYEGNVLHLTQWTWVYQIGIRFSSEKKEKPPSSKATTPKSWQRRLRQIVAILDVVRFRVNCLRLSPNQFLICDRYFYDLGIQGAYSGAYPPDFLSRYWRMVPEPTLSFLLDVPSGLAEQRETDKHETEYYTEKRALYDRYQPPWPLIQIESLAISQTQKAVLSSLKKVLNERS